MQVAWLQSLADVDGRAQDWLAETDWVQAVVTAKFWRPRDADDGGRQLPMVMALYERGHGPGLRRRGKGVAPTVFVSFGTVPLGKVALRQADSLISL